MKIGFVGLGAMGLPMALNLLRGAGALCGYDISEPARQRFAAAGGHIAANLSALAGSCDIIFTILPNARILEDVLCGNDGLLAHCRPNSVIVECSTIGVQSARKLHAAATGKGVRWLDAPITGGVHGAESGSLTFMAGGDRQLFDELSPILKLMGRKLVYAGTAGAGQAAKVCNNMAMGAIKAAISEAFVLAGRLGIDEQTFFEIASSGSAECVALTRTCPVPNLVENSPSNRGYQGGFATKLMAKDFGLAQEAAIQCGLPIPVACAAANLYQLCANAGHGDLDIGVVFEYLKKGVQPVY